MFLASRSTAVAGTLALLVMGCATPSDEADPVEPVVTEPATADPLTAAEQQRLNEELVSASWDNDVEQARLLIHRGADVDWRDETRQSAFLIASSEGFLELLNLTLDEGADVGLHDKFDGTGLIRATERGHWDVAGRLIQASSKIDHINNLGWTALLESIILGGTPDHATTVRVLIAGGADVTIPSQRDQLSAISLARARNQSDVVATLAATLPDTAVADPDQALLRAAAAGDADQVALALRSGARLEAKNDRARTALLLAVTENHLEVARLLVALGASPNAVDDQRDTPWLVTGVTGSVPMADLLLRFGADLTLLNRYGGTSLIPASERGHVEYVRRVAETKIDINHVNNLGWTALLEAVILGDDSSPYRSIVSALLAAGADRNIADRNGVTPLRHAHLRGHDGIAQLLESAS